MSRVTLVLVALVGMLAGGLGAMPRSTRPAAADEQRRCAPWSTTTCWHDARQRPRRRRNRSVAEIDPQTSSTR